ncbi:MAG: TenA family transcriptional regulator [Gemmatimonadales bacterium]|nr:TenA family transcriptional regulator [Gemmatimonadales bacterium]NIN12996.1 TenA family transcriptional regulator [Gemmatimonadales bacterium]NIN51073.1 TenA family transcriptional regulator [Gemmatimonadales bacterium]NIP08537.1 TenA family transcriptional regulator [Gemmatimonadales bacterium]NIR02255.1 TenA family transcriptional regulator [Gemmatimonadales bacterium]
MPFCADQLARLEPLWDAMLDHRFLRETRDGTISDERFAVWMRQDYLFVEAAIPFLAALLARAPRHHWEPLAGAIAALQKELKLFEERAQVVGVNLRGAPPSFTNHAYIQFLLATAFRASYAEAYTVLYTAEKAYHDSWKVVKQGIAQDSKWYPFVENWAGEEFAQYVSYLETELNALAEEAGPSERERMAEYFELTTKYEIAFWEMAATGEGWPAT